MKKIEIKDIDWNFIYSQLSGRKQYFHDDLKDKSDNLKRVSQCMMAIKKIQIAMDFALENM